MYRSLPSTAPLLGVLSAVLVTGPLGAQQPPDGVGVLFRDHEPLRLRIEADFDALEDDRDEDSEERDGALVIIAPDGTEASFPLEIRTRGKFRLQSRICRFPPLRLDVPRSQMDGTPFENQDKLKLVTHCRGDERHRQNTIKEYLIYRMYNVLTPRSFQVRLARIEYLDTSGEDGSIEEWAFLIEAEEAVAERLGTEVVPEDVQVHPARIGADDAARIDLFAFMVGNTDFSMYGPPQHNVVRFEPAEGLVVPVPYDFDWAGLVNAPYARPDASLGIRRVRQRVFRGLCRPGLDYPAVYALFQENRETMMGLVRTEPLLTEDVREDVLEYLDEFWEILDDPDEAERKIERSCRELRPG